jgi:hypothetical protein
MQPAIENSDREINERILTAQEINFQKSTIHFPPTELNRQNERE